MLETQVGESGLFCRVHVPAKTCSTGSPMSLCPGRTPVTGHFSWDPIIRVYPGLWTPKTLLIFLIFLAFQASSLQYEMLLLTDSISKEDSCWELRLRCGELGTIGWALLRNRCNPSTWGRGGSPWVALLGQVAHMY